MLQNRNFIKKSILTLIGIMFYSLAFAQDYNNKLKTYFGNPKANERVIGTITATDTGPVGRGSLSPEDVHSILLAEAKKKFPNKLINLRDFTFPRGDTIDGSNSTYYFSAKVVEIIIPLSEVVDKALSNVREGSRVAIDQISVSGGADRRKISDQLTDILLEKGYKVVAKSFLEQVQEEHIRQQSGSFNERTTAKTNNLSGIGYFLNVRVDEKSIRIQVINVSTGEFEGNVTVDF